ncbi:MAG: zinc-binding dehydrogenase [Chloroflexi bacterium]|nr:zinc-binding dehydrogenase [Chloroflexota bacterium]
METVLAAVKTGIRATELRRFPLPSVGEDGGLLQVDACGVCGADVRTYDQPVSNGVFIMGHEIVGRVAQLGKAAARLWGLREGDRIVVESYRVCGHCDACLTGYLGFCPSELALHDRGAEPESDCLADFQPSRGGGYSQYLFLWPTLRFHKVPDHVPSERAALAIPFGNGWQWAHLSGGAGPGKSVLVVGPGQQGLACTVAAKEAGAGPIIVAGLARDERRLQVAKRLGADHTINVEAEDLRERVRDLTGGEGADVGIEVAVGSAETVMPMIDVLRPRGTLVVVPAKGPLDQFPMHVLGRKSLTVKGVIGHSYQAVEMAVRTIASGKYPLHEVTNHQFGLDEVDDAIRATAGEFPDVIHASVLPWKKASDLRETARAVAR